MILEECRKPAEIGIRAEHDRLLISLCFQDIANRNGARQKLTGLAVRISIHRNLQRKAHFHIHHAGHRPAGAHRLIRPTKLVLIMGKANALLCKLSQLRHQVRLHVATLFPGQISGFNRLEINMNQVAFILWKNHLDITGTHIIVLDIAGIRNVSMINVHQLEFFKSICNTAAQNRNRYHNADDQTRDPSKDNMHLLAATPKQPIGGAHKNAKQHRQHRRFKNRAFKGRHHDIRAGADNWGFQIDQELIGCNIAKRPLSPDRRCKGCGTKRKQENGYNPPHGDAGLLLFVLMLIEKDAFQNTFHKQNRQADTQGKAYVFQEIQRAMAADIKHIRNLQKVFHHCDR